MVWFYLDCRIKSRIRRKIFNATEIKPVVFYHLIRLNSSVGKLG